MHFDLVVVGTGSGNTIMGREFHDLKIAIVESGRFGGTCLNVGCIPTKMYVYPADVAEDARQAGPLGRARHDRFRRLAGHAGPHLRPGRRDLGQRSGIPRGTEMAQHHGAFGHRAVHRAEGDDR